MPYMQPLLDARLGLPTEAKAAGTIAMFSVIPAAMLGIGLGVLLVPANSSFGLLLAVCSLTAAIAAAISILSFKLLLLRFGFRAVARAADAMIGGWVGLFVGGLIASVADSDLWPLLLSPICAALNAWLALSGPSRRRTPSG
jgi:hypothetical protein